jgi:hypothetical protein
MGRTLLRHPSPAVSRRLPVEATVLEAQDDGNGGELVDILNALIALVTIMALLALLGVSALVAGVDSRPVLPTRWI